MDTGQKLKYQKSLGIPTTPPKKNQDQKRTLGKFRAETEAK